MFYAVRENTPVSSLPLDLEHIHVVRPLSTKKMIGILQRCKRLNEIGASPTIEKRFTPKTKKMLIEKGISLVRMHRPGRAIHVDLQKITQIVDLKRDFLPVREISERTGVPKSTVYYLLKKAKREKVKSGKNVIYVR